MDELVFENLDAVRTLHGQQDRSAILYHTAHRPEHVQLDEEPNATLEGRVLIE